MPLFPEQILPALCQAQCGTVAGEICWKLGVTKNTLYWWREQYPDLSVGELRELWSLLVERVTVRYQSQRDVRAALQSADSAKSLHDRARANDFVQAKCDARLWSTHKETGVSDRRERSTPSTTGRNGDPDDQGDMRRPQVDALVRPEAPCA